MLTPKLFIWTPGYVAQPNHVEMIRVQSLVGRRLRRHLAGVEIVHSLVGDRIQASYLAEVAELGREFDQFHAALPDEYGSTPGIRRTTHFAIDLAREAGCSHVLRIIQDTYIVDAAKFARDVRGALNTPGEWLGAKLHQWETSWHWGLCKRMNLPLTSTLNYPNGAVMVAPLAVWEKFYVGLPAEINHHWDDVMMGEWMRHEGATLVDLPATWVHLHNCDPQTSHRHYVEHAAEVAPGEG